MWKLTLKTHQLIYLVYKNLDNVEIVINVYQTTCDTCEINPENPPLSFGASELA